MKTPIFVLPLAFAASLGVLVAIPAAIGDESGESDSADWRGDVRRYLAAASDEERAEILDRLRAVPVDEIRLELLRPRPQDFDTLAPGRHEIAVTIEGTELTSRYLLVIPEGYDPDTAWPLWISMHGTSGSGRDCAQNLRPAIAQHRFVLACPTAHESVRGRGWGFTAEERALTTSVLADVKRRVHVDTNRVVLNGWSRGGHACFDVAVHHPAAFAGINPVIGAPRAHYFGMLRNLAGMPVYMLNGAKDDKRMMIAVHNGNDYLTRKVKADLTYVEDPERGHAPLLDLLPGAVEAMMAARRDASPDSIVVAAHADARTEGAWLRIDTVSPDVHRPGAALRIPGYRASASESSKLTAAHKAVWEATAWVEAKRGKNAFNLKSKGVQSVTLLLDADAIDWKRNVRVTQGGRRLFSGKVQPSVGTLLEGYRLRRDPGRLFLAEIPIRLAK